MPAHCPKGSRRIPHPLLVEIPPSTGLANPPTATLPVPSPGTPGRLLSSATLLPCHPAVLHHPRPSTPSPGTVVHLHLLRHNPQQPDLPPTVSLQGPGRPSLARIFCFPVPAPLENKTHPFPCSSPRVDSTPTPHRNRRPEQQHDSFRNYLDSNWNRKSVDYWTAEKEDLVGWKGSERESPAPSTRQPRTVALLDSFSYARDQHQTIGRLLETKSHQHGRATRVDVHADCQMLIM